MNIKNINGAVIFKSKHKILRKALKEAVAEGVFLTGADLRGVDLSGAELRRTNLSGTNLNGADLNGAKGIK